MLEEENADNVNGSNGQGDDNDNDCDKAGADIDEPGDSWRRL